MASNVKGQIKFVDDDKGKVTLALDDIRQINTRHYKQEIYRIDGSVLTGKFEPHILSATLATSDLPVSFSLNKLKLAIVSHANPIEFIQKPVSLKTRLEIDDDQELVKIANLLDAGKFQKAGAFLDELTDPVALKSREKPIQQQIRVLQCEYLLRKGDYEGAFKSFKSLRKAKIEGVKWYAVGRHHVLKIYPAGEYRGQPLSDPEVFKQAANNISSEIIDSAREIMVAHSKAKIAKFTDWKRLESRCARMEKDLLVATSLILGKAERNMFQMWRFRQNRNWDTLKMLLDERESLKAELETRRANNKSLRRVAKKFDAVNRQIQTALIAYKSLRSMMNPLGGGPSYRVDDPNAIDFLN